ncbi:hypothetical protein FVEG_08773 [Fusarium verticillioides 7600]|uniref:Uncharacterized protein n=1 Tax=Gibberella moniliformis (strain M3125 / FGSC 7600) TaxID=334819 RepID=W7MMZ6_GIBM7|nr:hypothetical protein FVEG_08773 [Fusarium verticillioides 7600]EWG49179.1 hypothetical protein FVEG_08773 [Fusarium verticillioides 7600]
MGSINQHDYSSVEESKRILDYLCSQFDEVAFPAAVKELKDNIEFTSARDAPYFPIPFKETETTAALKAVEGAVASLLAKTVQGESQPKKINVNLEKTTAFLCQAYMAKVGGLGKLDPGVKALLKDTDLLQAQSNPYRRMSANLYETKNAGEYYHIHGSLEASTTLKMIGLEPFRPDLQTHESIVAAIEPAVRQFSIDELESMNAARRQAGVPALKHEDFVKTQHGKTNMALPPWSVDNLEAETPKCPLTPSPEHPKRILSGIKVLELCRIIAGPIVTRILGEYGADVLKITSPNLSDVPFFQVDGNMGKHAAELDLKSPEGRAEFEKLLAEADVVVDGYRPGALEKLGYGATALTKLAKERGKGLCMSMRTALAMKESGLDDLGGNRLPIVSVASRGSRDASWACQNPSSLLSPFRTTVQDALAPSQLCLVSITEPPVEDHGTERLHFFTTTCFSSRLGNILRK